jgi:hypothetical protein
MTRDLDSDTPGPPAPLPQGGEGAAAGLDTTLESDDAATLFARMGEEAYP